MKTEQTLRFDQLGLSKVALDAVADMGYAEPTPVQRGAIPAILGGNDVMAAAQTGTGKTAAFLLPTLDRLGKARKGQGPLMLVVTPTRELAQQIEATARTICARTQHRCTVVVGGVGYEPQKAALSRGCDLLVATPGRLIDLIDQGACNLGDVSVLVLDEADRMLDMGFAPAMRRIVSKTPAARQTLLFSATLDDNVLSTTKSLIKDPVRVEIAHKGTAAQTIDQFVLGVTAKDKVRILVDVLGREGSKRVIVFCRGKHRADMVSRKLAKAEISAAPIHGNRSQNQREAALKRFASGEVDVLVATDVLARGIDIAEVSYVVNLDVPSDAEDYIHRIGRTGRAGEYGWALTFVSEDEYLDLRDIEALMGKTVPEFPRVDGIDLGDEAFVLNANRKPTDTLPSKKARKKMQAAREAARAEVADAKQPAEPTRKKVHQPHADHKVRSVEEKTPEVSRASSQKASAKRQESRRADGSKPVSRRAEARKAELVQRGLAEDAAPQQQRRRHKIETVGTVRSEGRSCSRRSASSPSAPEAPKSRRRPGDKGGQR